MTFILIRLFSMLDFFALAICSALESNVLGNLAGEERGAKKYPIVDGKNYAYIGASSFISG